MYSNSDPDRSLGSAAAHAALAAHTADEAHALALGGEQGLGATNLMASLRGTQRHQSMAALKSAALAEEAKQGTAVARGCLEPPSLPPPRLALPTSGLLASGSLQALGSGSCAGEVMNAQQRSGSSASGGSSSSYADDLLPSPFASLQSFRKAVPAAAVFRWMGVEIGEKGGWLGGVGVGGWGAHNGLP